MKHKAIFVVIAYLINGFLSLVLYAAAFIILYLYFDSQNTGAVNIITQHAPIVNAGLFALLAAPLAVIPAYFINIKLGKFLIIKKNWILRINETDPTLQKLCYIALGIYFIPAVVLLFFQIFG
ncbi:hypothetical protein KC614_01475 [candidate division WWE3 bacterium]|uniref:Uncharacterized protein n=1 Tax=candidate division WWE3 bacterium TaxID=2053526 RepID=A0A955LKH4_UNCKA|nr:hypothetical protein [candidate division WWE3 bacterium]